MTSAPSPPLEKMVEFRQTSRMIDEFAVSKMVAFLPYFGREKINMYNTSFTTATGSMQSFKTDPNISYVTKN